jgi:excisionase family DNA binding protein
MNPRTPARNPPAQTVTAIQTVPNLPDHDRSALSVALSGPTYAPLSTAAPHPSPDPSTAGKVPTVQLKPLYRVSEAMALLSMSRTVIYELMRAGRLRSVREGRARLIPATAIADYVALLEHESMGRAA